MIVVTMCSDFSQLFGRDRVQVSGLTICWWALSKFGRSTQDIFWTSSPTFQLLLLWLSFFCSRFSLFSANRCSRLWTVLTPTFIRSLLRQAKRWFSSEIKPEAWFVLTRVTLAATIGGRLSRDPRITNYSRQRHARVRNA